MIRITTNRERKATGYAFRRVIRTGALEGTACQHCFLGAVKGNGPKLFPIADQLILCDDLVQSQFPLQIRETVNVN